MDVKTNKEYTAMLHEIEAVEKDIRSKEDQILVEMERLEGLTAEVRRGRRDPQGGRGRRSLAERKALDARESGAAGQPRPGAAGARRGPEGRATDHGGALRARRASSAAESVVPRGQDGMCGACHVKLRLQLWSDIRQERRHHPVPDVPADSLLRASRPHRRRRGMSVSALHIHIDGASRGNPGEAGFGIDVRAEDGLDAGQLFGYLGKATNNVAEYEALVHALRWALARGRHAVSASSPTPSSSCARSTASTR